MLDTGESIYRGMLPHDPNARPKVISKGVKQRVHNVELEDGKVYLRLSTEGKCDSDFYSSDEYKKIMQVRRSAAPKLESTSSTN